jgi:hypothetical protein
MEMKKFHLEGYPDVVKLVRLDGHKARQVAHYGLHKSDLKLASDCLERLPAANDLVVWTSAIVHFVKCFRGAGARSSLNSDRIYKGNALALQAFTYFLHLRNKHIVHDENSYTQGIPGAAINGGGKPFKVERIWATSVTGWTLEQGNFENLRLLIADARRWVDEKFEALCQDLTKELEKEPLQDLLAREEVTFTTPQLSEIGRRRKA